jgi:hypothetical protein
METIMKRGGRRSGAGRPRGAKRKLVTLRLEIPLHEILVHMASLAGWKPATFMQNELRKVAHALIRKKQRQQRPNRPKFQNGERAGSIMRPAVGQGIDRPKFQKPHWKDQPVIDITPE